MITLKPFTYRHKDGKTYAIEVEVNYTPVVTNDPRDAQSAEELQYDLEILDIIVWDGKMIDVTEQMVDLIPDSIIIREIELTQEDYIADSYLTEHDLYELGECYYGNE